MVLKNTMVLSQNLKNTLFPNTPVLVLLLSYKFVFLDLRIRITQLARHCPLIEVARRNWQGKHPHLSPHTLFFSY
jgi:hypothetical protein